MLNYRHKYPFSQRHDKFITNAAMNHPNNAEHQKFHLKIFGNISKNS